ncbi:hypothetical protein [uncultured Paracoccus sp.]|uniref:hypothetical protein n=1 Tax=uncultured Paracoccus sp. TaxID=189685 RepID=UPI0025D1E677|nr:hypothetical protein [uncultured Paracoccus sp.]
MNDATLTLDGLDSITGILKTGGDYARLTSSNTLEEGRIVGPHEGQLTIAGVSERVILESYRALEDSGCEITLRRVTPQPRS